MGQTDMGGTFSMKKLKRAVIKEELVALTGDYKKAIVLNQMIFWSERVSDFDKFIEEEKKRLETYGSTEEDMLRSEALELTNGWIYKTAEQLSEETMMNIHKSTMGAILNELVEKGWLSRRRNPKIKMDRTFQYRVNLLKIQKDLLDLGYFLEGYRVDLSELEIATSKLDETTSKEENPTYSRKTQLEVGDSNSNTIDYKQRFLTKDFVVVVTDSMNLFEQTFGQSLSAEQVTNLLEEANKYGKDLRECIGRTQLYRDLLKEVRGEDIKNPIGALRHEIQHGWDITPLIEELKKKPQQPQDFKPYDWVNNRG